MCTISNGVSPSGAHIAEWPSRWAKVVGANSRPGPKARPGRGRILASDGRQVAKNGGPDAQKEKMSTTKTRKTNPQLKAVARTRGQISGKKESQAGRFSLDPAHPTGSPQSWVCHSVDHTGRPFAFTFVGREEEEGRGTRQGFTIASWEEADVSMGGRTPKGRNVG